MNVPAPDRMGIALDRGTRRYDAGRVLVGGHPRRVLRLSAPGAALVDALQTGDARTPAARALARRLIDAGLAHPDPVAPLVVPGATVVIPVRDRAPALDRCLSTFSVRDRARTIVVDDGSADPAAVIAVCVRHGVSLLRRPSAGGPAAARNEALRWVRSELVAFLDSDCVAPSGWVDALVGYFEDPDVAAVAPRVRSLVGPGLIGRYAAARSPLDMGERPCGVTPGGIVSYVPTAALVVRRSALGAGFDPALRYGEDVDLIWRLSDAGGRVRYAPEVEVDHEDPAAWGTLLRRRVAYGGSAGPLARRHGSRLAPMVLQPAPTAVALLLLAGRPGGALAVGGARAVWMARRLRASGVPAYCAPLWTAQSVARTLDGLARTGTMLAAPALVAGLVTPTRARLPLALLMAGTGAAGWWRDGRGSGIDPLRWTAVAWVDDVAYGTGVWRGAIAARAPRALLPTVGGVDALRHATSDRLTAWGRRLGDLRSRGPWAGRDR